MWNENDWIYCEDRLPDKEGDYLVYSLPDVDEDDAWKWGFMSVLHYCDGWNCHKHYREAEITNVAAWRTLPRKPKNPKKRGD